MTSSTSYQIVGHEKQMAGLEVEWREMTLLTP